MEVGDMVKVKGTKGLNMTINSVLNGQVECVYFDENLVLKREFLNKDTVELVDKK